VRRSRRAAPPNFQDSPLRSPPSSRYPYTQQTVSCKQNHSVQPRLAAASPSKGGASKMKTARAPPPSILQSTFGTAFHTTEPTQSVLGHQQRLVGQADLESPAPRLADHVLVHDPFSRHAVQPRLPQGRRPAAAAAVLR
jgi:hypothetical protein